MRQGNPLAALLLALCVPFIGLMQEARGQDFTPTHFSVEVRGEGPDVILIPGLGSSPEVWADTAAGLEATHRLHLVHVAGFAGAPAAAGEAPLLTSIVAELDSYIRAEGLDRPAIIGHSMGGLAGLMLARVRPQSVGRLMIVDALPFYSVLFGPDATAESAAPQAASMTRQMVDMNRADFARMQSGGMARLVRDGARRDAVVQWTVESDRQTLAQAMYEVMTTDMRSEVAAIQTPLTILYAYDDVMGPAAQVDALYQGAYAPAPSKTLVRIDESRHFIMLDQPEAFHAAVARFLD